MKICVPIIGPTTEEALHDFGLAIDQGADILELRLDLMQRFDLEKLISKAALETLITIRTKDEGGKWEGTEEERYALFNEATKNNATYIDIEAKHYQPKLLKKRKSKLILSHHNFEKTPEELELIFEKIARNNPDIVKIATKANSYEDSKRMLKLIKDAHDVKPIIGICMGDKGFMTRVLGPQCGGYLTFAALEGKESAPGQKTIAELVNTYALISAAFK